MTQLHEVRRAEEAPRISLWVAALHLGALSSFAIAWQYFQPLSDSADLLVQHSVHGLDIVLFGLVMVLVPPVLLVMIEAAAGVISVRARDALHLVFVGGFVALIAWQFMFEARPEAAKAVLYPLSLLVGCLALLAYQRFAPIRSYLTVLSVGPVLVLFLFLSSTPIRTLAFGGDGPGPVRDTSASAPVVFILLDELPVTSLMDRSRRVDASLFPNFARLAGRSTWYRNATTVADHTPFAVPAMLTGKRPEPGKLPVASDHPGNLFRVLGESHRLNVMEWGTYLCTKPVCPEQIGRSRLERLRTLLSDTRVMKIPAFPVGLTSRVARRIRAETDLIHQHAEAAVDGSVRRDDYEYGNQQARVDAFLETLRPGRGTSLDFVHLLLPHVNWSLLPTGQHYQTDRSRFLQGPPLWSGDPRIAAIGQQRHLLQLQFVDRALGRITARLRDLGTYDDAAIIVTADHGVSFKPGEPDRDATRANIGEIASVPLFIKAPGQRRGDISDAFVENIDLMPTLAKELGLDLPWQMDGVPADQAKRANKVLTVQRQFGPKSTSVRHRTIPAERDAAVDRKLAIFGNQTSGLYAVSGYAGLIGRPLTRVTVGSPGKARATIDDEERFAKVDPNAAFLPAEITGLVRGGDPGSRRIAIALNGRIAATAWTLPAGKEATYSAIVPTSAFRSGRNTVEIFQLSGPAHAPRLRRLAP